MMRAVGVIAAALPAVAAKSNVTKHEITTLPGLQGKLPSKMRNGYVNGGKSPKGDGDQFYHYWLIESERDPAKDPIVFWYQGGPGASSLFGLMQEFGPLLLNAESYDAAYNRTGVPSLVPNPWSWSKVATIVAVDNPPPTGWSYCEPKGPGGDGYSCGDLKDSTTAAGNHGFLTSFFAGFPEYADNDVYISGESYGGTYVPTMVETVLDKPIPGMNLKGFLVIDGQYPVQKRGSQYSVDFMHGHGEISNSLYYAIKEACSFDKLSACPAPEHGAGYGSNCPELGASCQAELNKVSGEAGHHYGYNLYDECPHAGPFLQSTARGRTPSLTVGGGPPGTSNPCPLSALTDWNDLQATRDALGLDKAAKFFDSDNGEGMNYHGDHGDIKLIYKKAWKAGLRVVSLNGATDPSISGGGQDAFVELASDAGLTPTQSWRPWTVDGKQHVGGHMMEWNNGTFVWANVRGAGHMVPEYKPLAGLTFFVNYIAGTDYPRQH